MIKYIWAVAFSGLLLAGVLFSSCKNEDLNVGGYLVDSHMRIAMVDTLTVKVSSIAIDSLITSNKGVAFAGYYNDPEIGEMQGQSYIEFSRSADTETNKYATFDSVMLVLRLNGNYYGDTLKRPSIKVSKLVKQIEMQDDGYMYSTSSVPVGDMLLDTTFKTKVNLKEEIELRLPNSLGYWLFKGIRDKETYLDTYHYLKNFPGLSFSAGTGSRCVYGYHVQDSTCMIRIYYHISTSYKESKKMEFKANTSKQFYHFTAEKKPDLRFTSKSDPIPSSKTGNMGFLVSGTPIYARLEFPYLNEFLSLSEIVLIKEATLIVNPVHHTFDTVPLPSKLNLFYHDPTSNARGSELTQQTSGGTQVLNGNLPVDYRQQLTPHYSFNITDFISDQLGKMGYNKWALSLAIPISEEATSLQRLVFGDQRYVYKGNIPSKDNQIQLKVTYVTYSD